MQIRDVAEYLVNGPGMIFLFHPALGPLWSVVAQKVQGGRMALGSELVLEVAEAQVGGGGRSGLRPLELRH